MLSGIRRPREQFENGDFPRRTRVGHSENNVCAQSEPAVPAVAGIVNRGGNVLICQRPPGGHLPGLWEFPGGKIKTDEMPEAALAREIREEVGIEVKVGSLYWETVYHYGATAVYLRFFECSWCSGESRNIEVANHQWVQRRRLRDFPFLPADKPIIDVLSQEDLAAQPAPQGKNVFNASMKKNPAEIFEAFRFCQALASAHYENFPVASRLLSRRVRPHVAAVYAFARYADDFADEPEHFRSRLNKLDEWARRLEETGEGITEGPIFTALAETIRSYDLPLQPFRDLLSAFRQDLEVTRYPDFSSLEAYCRLSANPIGRIVLMLHGVRDEEAFRASDCICTALQIANHLQDVGADYRRGRIYLPQEELRSFGVPENVLGGQKIAPGFRALMVFQIRRVRSIFAEGMSLPGNADGRLGLELRAICRGGMAALEAIERADFDVLTRSPRLSGVDKASCFLSIFLPASRLIKRIEKKSSESADRKYCSWLVRQSRSNFYLAFFVMPPKRRRGLNAVYGFCRMIDDIVDSPGDEKEKRRLLGAWKESLERLSGKAHIHPVMRELAWAASAFGDFSGHLREVCEGVEMDLGRLRFHAFDDLRLYCEKVASAVGLASLPIFGIALSQAEAFARNTGLALQLTNILRDLGADAKEGRMYLPLEDLDRFGVKEEEIRRGAPTGEMMALLHFEAERARGFYREAERSLPDGKKWALFPPRLMAMIYRRLLEKIETDSFPVWGERPKLSVWSKLREVARCLLGV